jgi:exopolyphosphatase/pppGpp-phosphohydrolase
MERYITVKANTTLIINIILGRQEASLAFVAIEEDLMTFVFIKNNL